jgi:hypothetical protein
MVNCDPMNGSQFTMQKAHVYDLRANYRQSYYYWDRNDVQPHPTGLHGLTTNHDFATVRKIGSVNLAAYVTPNLRLTMEYQRTGRDGTAFTTRTLDYFGAPSTYAAFLRANPYSIKTAIDEVGQRATGGINYSVRNWNVFYKAGYYSYKENNALRNPVSPERSINIDEAATANELLSAAQWDEFRRIKGPISEFSYNGQPASRLSLRGAYIYYRFAGPATTTALFAGRARTTNATTIVPFTASVLNQADLHEPNHIVDQGFSYAIRDNVNFHADYRYSRFTENNRVEYTSSDAAGSHVGDETTTWKYGLQVLDLALELRPSTKFLIRPGLRLMKRDLRVTKDNVLDAQSSRPSKYASPLISLYYSPIPRFTLRGDLRNITNGGPYTRISPRTDFRTRWVAHYRVSDTWSIENSFAIRDSEYPTSSFLSKSRSNATMATYAFNENNSIFGGFIYDSFVASSAVTFLRGPAPLDVAWRDQAINRVWEGGIQARPIKPLALNLTGNYLRTTGIGEISGELPISGPIRWPLVTGTISWTFPRAGTLSIDLQRTYYTEEILTGDNFSANILGLRWTTTF